MLLFKYDMKLNIETLPTDIKPMSISSIAFIVSRDWKNVNFAAAPYLDAMYSLQTVKDNFMADSGVSVVRYFLGNAGTWRGPVAKIVKAHLKSLTK